MFRGASYPSGGIRGASITWAGAFLRSRPAPTKAFVYSPRMPEIFDDEVPLVTKALEHYHAYLVAAQREDTRYKAQQQVNRDHHAFRMSTQPDGLLVIDPLEH